MVTSVYEYHGYKTPEYQAPRQNQGDNPGSLNGIPFAADPYQQPNNGAYQQPTQPTVASSSATTPVPQAPSWEQADPNQNLSYLAFLRGAGMSESQARAGAARQKSQLQAQLEAQRPVWAQNLQQGLSRVLNNAAARGTVRGSNRIQGQNLVQQAIDRQRAAAESQTANQIGDIDLGLQSTLASLANQRAEAALNAQQQVYGQNQQDYQDQLANYYLQQLLAGGQNG